ncbi:hypothetical protein RB9072 [Rhodopirellula baltica SH 1]|uniref:Uncharacterized protein n=1 Tax=Rhodopirellula baltica (strain DSM 10527 / NCIMB 13988 / SH1) TaxID=243090 RepID=Q7UM50_RHOBA|nr:hypothetical protein RB9072 [Rhodopirellula baltica SH 1]
MKLQQNRVRRFKSKVETKKNGPRMKFGARSQFSLGMNQSGLTHSVDGS